MDTRIEEMNGIPVVAVSGRLDATTASTFDTTMTDMLRTPRPKILLDLSAVTYVSSAGLRSVLLLIKHTATHGGRLGLFSVTPQVMEVVEISGFPSLLDVYPDRDSALAAQG